MKSLTKNIYTLTVLVAMLLILFSCHEVEEQHLNFNQTIWNATKTWFDDNDRVVGSSTSVLEFLTESKGQEIYQDDNGESHSLDFKYRIDGSIIHFVDGLVGGDWFILEQTYKQLVLQSYKPHRYIMTMVRVY